MLQVTADVALFIQNLILEPLLLPILPLLPVTQTPLETQEAESPLPTLPPEQETVTQTLLINPETVTQTPTEQETETQTLLLINPETETQTPTEQETESALLPPSLLRLAFKVERKYHFPAFQQQFFQHHLPEMSAVSTTGLVLSLLGLTSLAGAGVAVGSGVSMMYMALAEEEKKNAAPTLQVHTPAEKKISVQRSFASKAQ
jgi:hypothetical protein